MSDERKVHTATEVPVLVLRHQPYFKWKRHRQFPEDPGIVQMRMKRMEEAEAREQLHLLEVKQAIKREQLRELVEAARPALEALRQGQGHPLKESL